MIMKENDENSQYVHNIMCHYLLSEKELKLFNTL